MPNTYKGKKYTPQGESEKVCAYPGCTKPVRRVWGTDREPDTCCKAHGQGLRRLKEAELRKDRSGIGGYSKYAVAALQEAIAYLKAHDKPVTPERLHELLVELSVRSPIRFHSADHGGFKNAEAIQQVLALLPEQQ